MKRPTRGKIVPSMLTRSFFRDPCPLACFSRQQRMHPFSLRGQIALSMLTRFSMVFFILMLFAIMVSFSNRQKEGVCDIQAQAMAKQIASTFTNVINSPTEDERKVLALLPAVSNERYWMEIENLPSSTNPRAGNLRVEVKTNAQCSGGARASYDESIVIDRQTLVPKKTFLVFPSNTTSRDFYLVLVKCRPKKPPLKDYLFLENCRGLLTQDVDPDKCLPLEVDSALSPNRVEACCGWRGTPQCP